MNAMVPGLAGGKMSSSDPNSKIDFLDPPEVIKSKIKKAFCEEGNVTENGLLAFIEAVLIPISQLRIERARGETGASADEGKGQDAEGIDQEPFISKDAPEGTVFSIELNPKFGGGAKHYKDYQELKHDFAAKNVHPGDLKAAVTAAITRLLAPIRKAFEANEEWQKVEKLAYPDPNAKPEKKKKVRTQLSNAAIVAQLDILI
jgi:tyrosyl-tRNA synthetase